jgi:hypothetical protein
LTKELFFPRGEPASVRSVHCSVLNLERTLSDLVNQAYALTPAEIELLWKIAPSRMPIAGPLGMREVPISLAEFAR